MKNKRICLVCINEFECTNTQIKNQQGIYCSYTFRNIGRTKSPVKRFWKHVKKTENCWLWVGSTNEHGYGQININGKPYKSHRFSYELHNGPLPKLLPCVLHKCDNPLCVNPNHLFPGTRQTNTADKVNKGRQCRGSSRPLAKLNDEMVREIRKSIATQAILAKQFGVSQSIISRIRSRKAWKYI